MLVLLIAEKLCLGGSGEGDFDRGYAGAFGYRQNSCRDKPAREPDLPNMPIAQDLKPAAKVTRKRPPPSDMG